MAQDNEHWLSEAQDMWESADQLYSIWEARWAKNELLVNSKHITARKAGQSNLFIPKIEQYLQSKVSDHVGAFGGEDPVSLRRTMTSSKEGASIMERVVNYYLTDAGGINWDAFIANGAANSVTYNFAPYVIEWDRGVEEIEVEELQINEEGEEVLVVTTQEQETYSFPTLEVIPPEDFRIDPSVSWDEVGMARFACRRVYRDKRYAEQMNTQGLWPTVAESEFSSGYDSSASSPLSQVRAFQGSPFTVDAGDIDNGLIEVRQYWFYADLGDGYVPVQMETLEDREVLSAPEPMDIDYTNRDGSDPFPFGIGRIYVKANEPISRAMPEKLESLQIEQNAIRNQRRDNVALALNPEKLVTPESGVDPATFSRSVTGKVTVVRNLNSVAWERAPDVTASAYSEEQVTVSDMERLVAESAMKVGASPTGKQSATEAKLIAAGSSRTMGFDSTIFGITLARPAVDKIIRAIKQAAPIEIFEAAAEDVNVIVEDPYFEAITGEYRVSVGRGALQSSVDLAISNASNAAAITQSIYGQFANYYELMSPIYEAMGLNPESIIPDPSEGKDPLQPHPSEVDLGGAAGGSDLTVQPSVQLAGGAFPGGGTSDTVKEEFA